MKTKIDVRVVAHQLVERMSEERLIALVDLLDDEQLSEEEIAEIRSLRKSEEWSDWRSVRNDV